MASANRILVEQPIGDEKARIGGKRRAARSVTVNQAESPLGWLLSRGHLTRRQYDAGERLRLDYERSALAPRVTMAWDSSPVARSRGGKPIGPEASLVQIDARRRFDQAIAVAGPGLSDILWRIVCSGGRNAAEGALGRPARARKLVLTIALDHVAEFYRIR
jgi:hypothetical protein